MEGGKHVNYWPGFVDALANVVVAMVFVIVVFAVSLLYVSSTSIKGAVAAAQEQAAQKQATRISELEQKLAAALQDNQVLQAQAQAQGKVRPVRGNVAPTDVVVRGASVLAPPLPAEVAIDDRQSALRVVFPEGAVELDAASLARLKQTFAPLVEQARRRGVELVAAPELGPYSEGKRLSYYRNLTLRNWLVDHGIKLEQIKMRIAESPTGSKQGVVQLTLGR